MENELTMGFRLDSDGYIVERPVVNLNGALPNNVILEPPIMPFIKPRWNGTAWVEGETAEEKAIRESQEKLNNLNPSPEAIKDAEIEVKVLTLLLEMGVIQ